MSMEWKTLSVDALRPAAYNPRKKLKPGDKEYEKIKNSIQELPSSWVLTAASETVALPAVYMTSAASSVFSECRYPLQKWSAVIRHGTPRAIPVVRNHERPPICGDAVLVVTPLIPHMAKRTQFFIRAFIWNFQQYGKMTAVE